MGTVASVLGRFNCSAACMFFSDPHPNCCTACNVLHVLQHWARLAIMGTVASVLGRFKLASPRSMTVESLAAGETFCVSVYPRAPLLLTFKPRTAAG